MGMCIYCGQAAGVLRKRHSTCESKYQSDLASIASDAKANLTAGGPMGNLAASVALMQQKGPLYASGVKALLAKVWSDSADTLLEDGLIDVNEERLLSSFKQSFGLSQDELNANGSYTRVAQAGVLRDLESGKLPARVSVAGALPINFQKGESLIWVFRDVKMYEDKTRREYVGTSQGISFQVMKGVRYRVGSFKGHPVDTTERVLVDQGMLVVTNNNIYFSGTGKALRLPFAKIVAFYPYSEGVGVMKDGANAKAQVFVTGNGWFSYNLLVNAAKLA